MANVLILSLVFPPDAVSTAQIMGELAVDLQQHGHRVTVLTTTPHYNRDPEAEARQPRRRHWTRVLQTSRFHGIRVIHAWMPSKGASVVGRLLAWLQFHVVSTIVGAWIEPRPDVLLVPSPPLTIGVSAWIVAGLRRARFVYNVQEIYPDIAVNLGALRNRTAIGLLGELERFVYRRAALITVIAPRMHRRLIEKGVPPAKVLVIPNFVDVGDLAPRPKRNAFSEEWGLAERFAVTYAGNLGPAQGLETVVGAAALLRDDDVELALIGSGISEAALGARIAALRLGNCRLIPHQPYSRVPDIYAASDVCLVTQAVGIGTDAIPSKVYRIMACARPIIACTDPASDLGRLIADSGGGRVVPPGSAEALAAAVRDARRNPAQWREMGEAGCRYVRQHYARAQISRQYHTVIERLVRQSPAPAAVDLLH